MEAIAMAHRRGSEGLNSAANQGWVVTGGLDKCKRYL